MSRRVRPRGCLERRKHRVPRRGASTGGNGKRICAGGAVWTLALRPVSRILCLTPSAVTAKPSMPKGMRCGTSGTGRLHDGAHGDLDGLELAESDNV